MLGAGPKLTIGRLKGIALRLDVTFVFVPLVLFSLMSAHLDGAVWPAAVVATLGVFLSILLHELGHAAAARVQQVGVAEIVIGGFFGYTSLKKQAVFRQQQIRILLAGPLANLAIFLILWLILTVAQPTATGIGVMTHQSGMATDWFFEALRVLALANLGMFAFNVLPAYPPDGGRVLGLLLGRRLAPRTNLLVVSVLGIAGGVLMVIFSLGLSFLLALIGVLIVAINFRRIRRASGQRTAA